MVERIKFVVRGLLILLTVNTIYGCDAANAGHVKLLAQIEFSLPNNINVNTSLGCNDYAWKIIQLIYSYTIEPFHALRLYNMVEKILNLHTEGWQQELVIGLDQIRSGLLWNIILPQGTDFLECAVNYKRCQIDNSTVSRWLDDLNASNETVSDLVIGSMVERVRWTIPADELVPIMANLSTHVQQNVAAMLALYEFHEEQFLGEVQMDFLSRLWQLKPHADYLRTVSKEKQRRVDALFPQTIKTLLGGEVCLNQVLSNGSKIYIYQGHYKIQCAHVESPATKRAVHYVSMTGNLSSFNFVSRNWPPLPIYLKYADVAQPEDFTYNVMSPDVYGNSPDYMDWKIQLDGAQLVIQSMNRSLVICAGSSEAMNKGPYKEWWTYTRNSSVYEKYQAECRWNVEDCHNV